MSGRHNQRTSWGQPEQRQDRLQHQLQVQSEQIERVFSQHHFATQVAGGTVRPSLISFDLTSSLSQGWERLRELTQELKAALNVPEVHLSREDGQLKLHITRPEPPPVALLDLLPLLPDLPPVTGTLGLDEDGRPVLLDFDNPDVTHVLITGESDAGKTTLMRTLALSLALKNRQSRLQLLVIDSETAGSRRSYTILQPLSFLPHMLAGISYRLEESVETLKFLQGEMEYRRQQQVKLPTIVVFIDNVDYLLADNDNVCYLVQTLLQGGAAVGIHCVLGVRQAETAVFNNQLRANLPVRIVGKVSDDGAAQLATGLPDTQAEYLLGQGDFLAVVGGGVSHFQAAYIGDYDLHLCLDDLHRNRPLPLLAQPVSLRTRLMDDNESHHQTRSFQFDGWEVMLAESYEGKDTVFRRVDPEDESDSWEV